MYQVGITGISSGITELQNTHLNMQKTSVNKKKNNKKNVKFYSLPCSYKTHVYSKKKKNTKIKYIM